MVIDKDTTQMHTFSKGMNTDTSDAYLEEGLYRLANNLRYVTNQEENSGELHMIEGATLFTDLGYKVLAATQLRLLGIVITTGKEPNHWRVYTIDHDNNDQIKLAVDVDNTEIIVGSDKPGPAKRRVLDAKKLSLVTRWEDDENAKLYIADGLGPIIVINLCDCEYDRLIEDLVAYPAVEFAPPRFAGLIDGHLKSGMYEYAYQFYNKHGQCTEISPSTKLIPLHNGALRVEDSNRIQGYEKDVLTNKGINIEIPLDNPLFTHMIIYRILYAEVGVPPIIGVVLDELILKEVEYKEEPNTSGLLKRARKKYEYYVNDENERGNGKITLPVRDHDIITDPDVTVDTNTEETAPSKETYYLFSDTGRELLSVISLEEYNMMTGIHIIPKTIESMTDYMFASNILNDNPIYADDKIKEWERSDSNVDYSFIVADLIGDVNDSDSKITIKGNADTFTNKVLVRIYDKNGNESGTGEVSLSNFIHIKNNENNRTYMNPYVSYSLKSLRRGEVYRYGIVFYDKYNNASAVKHLADVTVPENDKIPAFLYNEYTVGSVQDSKLHVRPIGVRFSIKMPDTDNLVAYEIVRCGKDLTNMSTIMLCVISRPILRLFDTGTEEVAGTRKQSTTQPLTPTGYVTNMDCWYGPSWDIDLYDSLPVGVVYWNNYYAKHSVASYGATNSGFSNIGTNSYGNPYDFEKINGNERILQVISPEYSYMSETVKDMLQKNVLTIQPLIYISPITVRTGQAEFYKKEYNPSPEEITVYSRIYDNVGNDYANVIIEDSQRILDSGNTKALCVQYGNDSSFHIYDTIIQYYFQYQPGTKRQWDYDEVFHSYKNQIPDSRYAYIKLYTAYRNLHNIPLKINITSTGYPDSLSWDDFASTTEKWSLTYPDHITAIGGRSFCNWVSGGLYGVVYDEKVGGAHFKDEQDGGNIDRTCSEVAGMMGPGGKCMLIAVDNDYLAKVPDQNIIMGTYLCNIKQSSGGYTIEHKYCTYRSYGNYFKYTKADRTNVSIFDGDCFILPFEYVSQHKWYHPYIPNNRNDLIVYSIPMETSINLAYTHGYELSKYIDASEGNITNVLVDPANVNNSFILDIPLYAYNGVYGANSTSKTLAAEDTTNSEYFDSKFDYRVFNSVPKVNDESIDNWLKFLPANFLDVDTRYGEITGLRKFNNNLVFWQENAAGILSVNERVQITDDTNMPLTLGTADVLSRYDYINTSNGMRVDEYADAQSDTTLYWWDHNKHEIIGYSGGALAVSVSKSKFVLNFLNEMDDTGKLIDEPLVWHDKEFNEVGFAVSDGDGYKKGSIIFGENIGAFSALYTVLPHAAITFKDSTFLLNKNGAIFRWNNINYTRGAKGLNVEPLYPYLKYIVNQNSVYTKVFDNTEIAGRLYGGSYKNMRTYEVEYILNKPARMRDSHSEKQNPIKYDNPLNKLTFAFSTPLKQHGEISGDKMDNTEYNFRFAIPRDENQEYGGRLRGKTMQAELKSASNSYDFSLQYIFTKYRISWS